MKRRQTMTQSKPTSALSPGDKVDMLEKTLSIFRKEVNMKLRIMQQILTTRNEQVFVQKKLLEREQTLYGTLLGHWKNIPKLAATGLSVNFSSADILEDLEDEENQSDQNYAEGDDVCTGPNRKKSKSSLRRQRNSAKTTPKQRINVGAETGPETSNENLEDANVKTDSSDLETSKCDLDGEDEPQNPPVHVELRAEGEEDDDFEYDVSLRTDTPEERKHSSNRRDKVWDLYDCIQRDPKSRRINVAVCKKCKVQFSWAKVERLRKHTSKCENVFNNESEYGIVL